MRRCPTCNTPVPHPPPPREQFEQVLAEFRTIVRRLELIEDRLDRKDRPYGDGTRHDSRRR